MPEIKSAIVNQNSTLVVVGSLESDGDTTKPIENLSSLKIWGCSEYSIRLYDIDNQHSDLKIIDNTPFELPLINGRTYNKIKIQAHIAPLYYQYLIL
jgi:hypothetical protein